VAGTGRDADDVRLSAGLDRRERQAKLWRERAETVLRDGLEPIVDSAMRRWFAPEFLEENAGRARNLTS
jgi:hypothetical protein